MPSLQLHVDGDDALLFTEDLDVAARQVTAARIDPAQQSMRDEVLSLVRSNSGVAHRSSAAAHLTGSALVVDAAATRTLLMLHRKLGRWFQPGGHADGNANLAAVALREATEETGISGLQVVVPAIDLDIHRVEPPNEEPHLHLDLRFLVVAPLDPRPHGNHESLGLRWVSEGEVDDLDPPIDASTRRLVARGLACARSLHA